MVSETMESISFGSFALEKCELLSMGHVQADGYFEAQASARLAEESQGKEEDVTEEVEEFEKQVARLTQSLTASKKEDQKKTKKKRPKKIDPQAVLASGTEEEGQQADVETEFGNDKRADLSEEEIQAGA